jgi:hypothetical protein
MAAKLLSAALVDVEAEEAVDVVLDSTTISSTSYEEADFVDAECEKDHFKFQGNSLNFIWCPIHAISEKIYVYMRKNR